MELNYNFGRINYVYVPEHNAIVEALEIIITGGAVSKKDVIAYNCWDVISEAMSVCNGFIEYLCEAYEEELLEHFRYEAEEQMLIRQENNSW